MPPKRFAPRSSRLSHEPYLPLLTGGLLASQERFNDGLLAPPETCRRMHHANFLRELFPTTPVAFIRPVVEILTALLKSEGFLSFGPKCRCRPKTNDESRDRERCDN